MLYKKGSKDEANLSFVAAAKAQPGQAKGIDSALRTLAHTPGGPWLLVLVALGLVMFGLFSCCEARWRRV